MATIGAFIYNLSTDLVGGIEVTLADRDWSGAAALRRWGGGGGGEGFGCAGVGTVISALGCARLRAYSSGG